MVSISTIHLYSVCEIDQTLHLFIKLIQPRHPFFGIVYKVELGLYSL